MFMDLVKQRTTLSIFLNFVQKEIQLLQVHLLNFLSNLLLTIVH